MRRVRPRLTMIRLLSRLAPLVVTALMVYLAVGAAHHETAAIGLACVTGGTLLAGPELIEGVLGHRLTRRLWPSLTNYYLLGVLLVAGAGAALALSGPVLGGAGVDSAGRARFAAGTALLMLGVVALVPLWMLNSRTRGGLSLSAGQRQQIWVRLERIEASGAFAFVAFILFAVGTALQFFDFVVD